MTAGIAESSRLRHIVLSPIKPTIFLDFDGTITALDVVDAILKTHADPQWLHIEEAWESGRIGSRECLQVQMGLVTATQQQIDSLLDQVEIDEGFGALIELCSRHLLPVHIVSDGFDYCIQRILNRPSLQLARHLPRIRIISSHLELIGQRWDVSFPLFEQACVHGCATCKPAAMKQLNETGGPTIFVGDGLSDRYAAACADVVFAKDKLARFCDDRFISYSRYDRLATIAVQLEQLLSQRSAAL